MVIALCIANAYYFGLHARGEPHCDSHPECSLSIFDLFHFLFFQKVHSDETCPSYSLFLCSLCFLPCIACCHGKYIGSRRATKIWICCWIYFQIRTMLSGGPLVLCFVAEHPHGSSHLVLFKAAPVEESSKYLIPGAL